MCTPCIPSRPHSAYLARTDLGRLVLLLVLSAGRGEGQTFGCVAFFCAIGFDRIEWRRARLPRYTPTR